jgi:hypothetical protein
MGPLDKQDWSVRYNEGHASAHTQHLTDVAVVARLFR